MSTRAQASDAALNPGAELQDSGTATEGRTSRSVSSIAKILPTILGYTLAAQAIYIGWNNRSEEILTAESGLGYALGIVGGSMMLLLLLYPLRKKARFMQALGPVRHWFRMHMIFGVMGPVLILFHSNFSLGSMNASVALLCMLAVASSGLVGRYLYSRIHYGLYGKHKTLEKLQNDAVKAREKVRSSGVYSRILSHLETFEKVVSNPPQGIFRGIHAVAILAIQTRIAEVRLRRFLGAVLRRKAQKYDWTNSETRKYLREYHCFIHRYLCRVRQVAKFNLFERLFAAWHIFHFPLFLMLVIAGTVHVVAVHMY